MKLTLRNAVNPLELFRRVFDEHVTAPMLALQQAMHDEHVRKEIALIRARYA